MDTKHTEPNTKHDTSPTAIAQVDNCVAQVDNCVTHPEPAKQPEPVRVKRPVGRPKSKITEWKNYIKANIAKLDDQTIAAIKKIVDEALKR